MVTTEHAKHFYNSADISVKIYSDKDEWEVTNTLTSEALLIDLCNSNANHFEAFFFMLMKFKYKVMLISKSP